MNARKNTMKFFICYSFLLTGHIASPAVYFPAFRELKYLLTFRHRASSI